MEVGNVEKSVSKIYIHASYNQPKFANDIAIIELDVENEGEINDAVCLPELDSGVISSSIALMKHQGSPVKFGKAEGLSNDKCSSFFNQQITQLTVGQYCAKLKANGTTSTQLIGAIVFESDRNQQYFFKGFTSTSVKTEQASDENKPYIFTDLSQHINWIRSAIGGEFVKNKTEQSRNAGATHKEPSCQMSNGSEGSCVEFQQCSLFRDAPQPFTEQRLDVLNRIRCFTQAPNVVKEDGVCCPLKYIELDYAKDGNFDIRFLEKKTKRGVELLDMIKCGKITSTRRIVGGSQAELQEFPWIGLVKYEVGRIFKYTCGSSLISNRYVVTCAHCITNLPNGFEVVAVRLGEHDRSTDVDCVEVDEKQKICNPPIQDISIEKLIPHQQYNQPRYANDIGVIRLAETPDMTKGECCFFIN